MGFSVTGAVCAEAETMHYVYEEMASGIAEFMTPDFMKRHYGPLLKAYQRASDKWQNVDWASIGTRFIEVACLPLSTLLAHNGIPRIYIMVLDVEGAEVQVLRTLDVRS